MAQKELLFVLKQIFGRGMKISRCLACLMLILTSTNHALALEDKDREWAREVVKNAQRLTMDGIKDKYIELQRMLGASEAESSEKLKQELLSSGSMIRVFVSSSMSRELLKSYVKEAKDYGAVLVFKGLPNGSWQELAGLISYIAGDDEEVSIQIDDEAFDRFEIRSVPAFVLSKDDREFWRENKQEVFDKVTGNIGIRGALEMMAKNGDLADEAVLLFEGVK